MAVKTRTQKVMDDSIHRAQKIIADKMFREVFSSAMPESHRYELFVSYLNRTLLDPAERPLIGVGISLSTNGSEQLEFLTPLRETEIDVKQLLHRLDLSNTPFHVISNVNPIPAARPIQGGDSIGDWKGSSGTLGCMVHDKYGTQFMLSCNHVLAGLNTGKRCIDETREPAKGKRIGVLHEFRDIAFGAATANIIDAALSKPDYSYDVHPMVGGRAVLGYVNPVPYQAKVTKHGAATGKTDGTVIGRDFSFLMPYSPTQVALFEKQILITGASAKKFAKRGDSGSLVLDSADQAVGLLFGTDGIVDLAYVNPIEMVLNYFGMQIS